MATLKQINEDLLTMGKSVHALRNRVQALELTKVDKDHFQWLIGILMTIVIGLLGAMFYLILQTSSDVKETSSDVSYIYGFIETLEKNYNIKIQD